jgi:hypothetical protein
MVHVWVTQVPRACSTGHVLASVAQQAMRGVLAGLTLRALGHVLEGHWPQQAQAVMVPVKPAELHQEVVQHLSNKQESRHTDSSQTLPGMTPAALHQRLC